MQEIELMDQTFELLWELSRRMGHKRIGSIERRVDRSDRAFVDLSKIEHEVKTQRVTPRRILNLNVQRLK